MAAAVHMRISVVLNHSLSPRLQKMSSTRHIARTSILCVGCPQMQFLSVRHKEDTRRNHFAWQHTQKRKRGGYFVVVVVVINIVSWVPPTKKCCVVFK
jgi:hypothetical protein